VNVEKFAQIICSKIVMEFVNIVTLTVNTVLEPVNVIV
jgi:hypothetical protein